MNIIIIDDEVDTHLLYKLKFKKLLGSNDAVNLIFFLSAEECLLSMEQDQLSVDMVLTDINMPGMDGFELLRHLKEQIQDVPVYMVSAYESNEYRQKATELGANGFLSKPVDFSQLAGFIQSKVLEKHK